MTDKETVERVRAIIATDTTSALYVLRVIWERQTPREKYYRAHMGHDGKGFREHETPTLCTLHDDLEDAGWRIAASQADMLRERMPAYARQYCQDSRERGVDPLARLPRRPGADGRKQARDADITSNNRRKGSHRKLTDEQRARMQANIDRMAERAGV